MSCNAFDDLVFMSSMVSKRHVFNFDFNFDNKKKLGRSLGAPGLGNVEDREEQSSDFWHKIGELIRLSQ